MVKDLFRERALFPQDCFSAVLCSLYSQVLYKQVWPPGSVHTSQMVNLGKQTYFHFNTSFSVCTLSAFLLGRTGEEREKHTHSQMMSCWDWLKHTRCLINPLLVQPETLTVRWKWSWNDWKDKKCLLFLPVKWETEY